MYRVDQQDSSGRWWEGVPKYATEEDAALAAAWMDCPARVVQVE